MATKKKKQTEAFVPSSPLGEAIIAGDNDAVLAVLAAYDDKQRVAARAEAVAAREHVEAGEWGHLPGQENTYGFITAFSDEQRAAARTAVIVLGTAKQAADAVQRSEESFALLQRFRPAHLPELAGVLVESRWPNIDLAQALITAGLSTRPKTDAYVLGLIRWSDSVRWRRHKDANSPDLYQLVLSDKGLVDDGVILRLFAVEGTREVSLGIQDKYGKGDSWADVLVRLVAEKHLARDVVIDATLSAIERDWPQFRGGWYLRFLDALALTDAERDAHADRFLGLLHSRIPPTVSTALDVVVDLVARSSVAATTVLPALSPVVGARGKGQVKTALKLAATLRKRHHDDDLRDDVKDAVHRLAIDALVNEDATLQALALDLLDEPRSDDVDAALQAATDLVAPRLRARVAAMTKTAVSTSKAPPTATVSVAAPASAPTTTETTRVEVPGADDLVDVVARAFESNDDPIVLEQALAGLVQHAAAIREAKKTWAALRKRANKIERPLSSIVAGLLIAIVDDVAITPPRWTHGVETLFLNRAVELRTIPARLVPLGTSTRVDGSIDIADLVDRVAAFVAAGVDVDAFVVDGQLALLRTTVDLDDATRTTITSLPPSAFVTALRVAVGMDDVEAAFVTTSPFALAGYRRRHGPYALSAPPTISYERHLREKFPDYTRLEVERAPLTTTPHAQALQLISEEPGEYSSGIFADGEYGMVRFALTLWPAALDALLIDGVKSIAGNVSWAEACWQHRALVEALHDPRLTMRSSSSLATMIMVLGLCGKEAGRVTITVDALVAGIADGRVDVDAVGAVASRVIDEGLVLCKRIAAALKTASDVDASTADAIRRLVERALSGDPARAPRDVSALLSLLVHLRVDVTTPLPATTRAYLEGLTGGGQVAKEKKLLLA